MTALTEDEYLVIVDHAERALLGDNTAAYAVINIDMVQMLAAYREHQREIEQLYRALSLYEREIAQLRGRWPAGYALPADLDRAEQPQQQEDDQHGDDQA